MITEDISDNAVDEKNEETFGVDGNTNLFSKVFAILSIYL